MAEEMAGDSEQPDSSRHRGETLDEDRRIAMHHLQEMMAAIFRIAKRDGVLTACDELRAIVTSLIAGERRMRTKEADIAAANKN